MIFKILLLFAAMAVTAYAILFLAAGNWIGFAVYTAGALFICHSFLSQLE